MTSEQQSFDEDEWRYDCYVVGRATRTVDVPSPPEAGPIEEGTLTFEAYNDEDLPAIQAEDGWMSHFIDPDGDDPLRAGTHLWWDLVGVLVFPEPMTDQEAGEWLEEEPERWRQFVDDEIESDTTAADLLEEIR